MHSITTDHPPATPFVLREPMGDQTWAGSRMQTLALPKLVFTLNSALGFGTFSSAYLIKNQKKENGFAHLPTHVLQSLVKLHCNSHHTVP